MKLTIAEDQMILDAGPPPPTRSVRSRVHAVLTSPKHARNGVAALSTGRNQ
jgi:hypothetical protein